jgi:hypothetical protein
MKSRLSIIVAVIAMVDHRSRARPPGLAVALVVVGGLVAHELEAVAPFDQGQPRAIRFSSSTDLTSLPSCSRWALLRLLVVVEFALDPVGGAVEDVDGRPEEIVEVGFDVLRRRSGRRRCRRRAGDDAASGKAADRVRRRRGGSRRAEAPGEHGRLGMSCGAVRVVVLAHGMLRRLTATVAAFMATKPTGGRAARAKRGLDGEGRLFCLAMESGLGRAGK